MRTFRHLLTIFSNCTWSMQGQLGQFDFYGETYCHIYEESIFSALNPSLCSVVCIFHRKQDSNFIQCQFGYWIACQNKQWLPGHLPNNWNSFDSKGPLLRLFSYSNFQSMKVLNCSYCTVLCLWLSVRDVAILDHLI